MLPGPGKCDRSRKGPQRATGGHCLMVTLHLTRGLPASGKTTWAMSWVAQDRAGRARGHRDDLRKMLDDGVHVKGVTEQRVMAVRDAAIVRMLRNGIDVVCDDTNLPQRIA